MPGFGHILDMMMVRLRTGMERQRSWVITTLTEAFEMVEDWERWWKLVFTLRPFPRGAALIFHDVWKLPGSAWDIDSHSGMSSSSLGIGNTLNLQ